MSAKTGTQPEERLPRGEILHRLSSEIGQLRRLLGLYRHEPNTANLFDWRQRLQRRLLELEQQCRRTGFVYRGEAVPDPKIRDAKALFSDFLSLEAEITDYIRQARI